MAKLNTLTTCKGQRQGKLFSNFNNNKNKVD